MRLAITRAALACPLGLYRRAAIATMRSGLVVFEANEEHDDATLSRTSTLAPDLPRSARIAKLLAHVLRELTGDGREASWRDEALPVFISLPTLEPAVRDWLLAAIRAELGQRTGFEVLLTPQSVIPGSRAGIFTALRWAEQVVAEGRFPRVALLAADSLVAPETLRELERSGVLLGPGNGDGRVVGEAAAALLVEAPGASTRGERLATVIASDELRHEVGSFEQVRAGRQLGHAQSLTQLFARMRAGFPNRTDLVVSGQPSEAHWAREFSYAYLRNVELMPEPLNFVQTGAEIGDAGAASGAVALIRALSDFEPSSWRPSPASALVYAVGDRGHAGVALLGP